MQSYQDIKRAGMTSIMFRYIYETFIPLLQRTCERCLQNGWEQPELPDADV